MVADRPIAARLKELMQREGAYFMDEISGGRAAQAALHTRRSHQPGLGGQIAAGAGGHGRHPGSRGAPASWWRPLTQVGRGEPLSREKLTTVLGWYEADGWEAGCERCIELIQFGGRGHSLVIHATDEKVIMAFGLEKPVFRIAVNTMGTLGSHRPDHRRHAFPDPRVPGGIGGAITGDNITVYHLFNVKRLAYELTPPPEAAFSRNRRRPAPLPRRSKGWCARW